MQINYITYKRGSAKHGVKNDNASLLKCDFRVSAKPKPINQSTLNFA
jgi:hypothetical protein